MKVNGVEGEDPSTTETTSCPKVVGHNSEYRPQAPKEVDVSWKNSSGHQERLKLLRTLRQQIASGRPAAKILDPASSRPTASSSLRGEPASTTDAVAAEISEGEPARSPENEDSDPEESLKEPSDDRRRGDPRSGGLVR